MNCKAPETQNFWFSQQQKEFQQGLEDYNEVYVNGKEYTTWGKNPPWFDDAVLVASFKNGEKFKIKVKEV